MKHPGFRVHTCSLIMLLLLGTPWLLAQKPVLISNQQGPLDTIVNEQVKIPVANKKPVFIRNFFIEEKTLDDSLDIGSKYEPPCFKAKRK